MNNEKKLLQKIRLLTWFFIIGLALSGITAFPLEWELSLLNKWCLNIFGQEHGLSQWIERVYEGLVETNTKYPFMAYGTDWLAFAHLVIAVNFFGPLKDPVKNIWVIQFGIIACIMVIPLAFIAGAIRDIPLYWRLIDCSFGVLGITPLYICLSYIRKLEKLKAESLKK
jgi:hypothetical protein